MDVLANAAESIPIVDLSPIVLDKDFSEKDKMTREISFACQNFGFFYVTGHGVDEKLQENLENMSRQFFAQPPSVKEEISMTFGGKAWRGYFPVAGELTSGWPDMKEGIYFGAELPDEHPMVKAQVPLHGSNLFPSNMPEYKETVLQYIQEMTRLGHQIMKAIALSLNLQENYFFDTLFTKEPLPLFRIFNYPALDLLNETTESKQRWGVGEHTDYGILTIVKQDDLGGLEVKSRQKSEWIQAPPIKGSFICNLGDMLDRMTGGLYRSTPHRVRRPRLNKDRISFPFFFDPNFNSEVRMIQELKKTEEDKIMDDKNARWDKVSVHEFEGIYGDYLLAKVGKAFPQLLRQVL